MSLADLIGTGYANLQDVTRALGQLAQSPENAQKMVQLGIRALDTIEQKLSSQAGGVFTANWLFGGVDALSAGEKGKRQNIRAHLNYYANGDNAMSGFWDIRDWTLQAFVAYNAGLQNLKDEDRIGDMFFSDAQAELEQLFSKSGAKVADVAGDLAGWTLWAFFKGFVSSPFGMAVVAGAAYLGYRYYAKPYLRFLR